MNKIFILLIFFATISLFSCKDPYMAEVDKDKHNSLLYTTSNSSLLGGSILAVEWKDNNTLYASCYNAGGPNKGPSSDIIVYSHIEKNIKSLSDEYSTLRDVHCNDIKKDKSGNIYFATQNGLFILNNAGILSSYIPDDMDNTVGITKLCFDQKDTLWAISGTSLLRFSWNVWKTFQYYETSAYYPFNELSIDSKNNKWIGSNGGGIYLIDNSNNLIKDWDKSNSSLKANYVSGLVVNPKDEVYAFTYSQNPYANENFLYTYKNGNWTTLNRPYGYYMYDGVAHKNNLWFGSYTFGLLCYDGSKWFSINTINSALSKFEHVYLNDISITEDDKIAAAVEGGLFIAENIYINKN